MKEGIIEEIYNSLETSTTPTKQLLYLYTVLFGEDFSKEVVKAIGKMVKLFGRRTVFFALLDFANWENRSNIYRGLYYLCVKKLERKSIASPSDDLSSMINYYKKLARKRGKK